MPFEGCKMYWNEGLFVGSGAFLSLLLAASLMFPSWEVMISSIEAILLFRFLGLAEL